MAFHRAQTQKEFEAAGMTPKAARLAARRQFGNDVKLREQSQEQIGFRFESVAQDLRFALRQLRKNPSFAITAVAILALGIGASVAIFGFVDAALIKPLPYQSPARLAMLFESNPLGPRFHLSYLDYLDWKKRNKSFTALDIFAPDGFMLKTSDGVQRATGAAVTAGFFQTLGVVPVLGRDFSPGEDSVAAARTVLLSYGAWQKRYGGRPDAIGQTVTLDGKSNIIIGVLPRSFHFAPAEPAEFWGTLRADGECEKIRGCHDEYGVARLRDGFTFAAATADIKAVAEQLQRQYPDSNRDRDAVLLPLTEVIVGDIRPILLVLLGGAALLLLIASVNVASLLLVRSESRRREIAVRGALGASAGRLMRQFITEGLLLAVAGNVLGVAVALEAMRLLTQLVPAEILATMPYLQGAGLNVRVAIFAALVCVITGTLFALTPSFRISFSEMREGLADGSRGSAGTLWRRFGVNLVVIEIATAMVLLVGAGLLGKSLYRLLHSDAGMAPDHLAMLNIAATGGRYEKDAQILALQRQIVAEAEKLPGVQSVGLTSRLPLGDGDGTSGFVVLDHPYTGHTQDAANRFVTSGYFQTLRARILRGRDFRRDEDGTKPRVVIINTTMASQYFRYEDPVGQRLAYEGERNKPYEIIGVVNDLQEGQLDAAPRAAMYVANDQDPRSDFALVVRTAESEQAMPATLAAMVHRIDPAVAVYGEQTMSQRVHDSPSAYLHRSSAWMVGVFAVIALLLSVVGLYGVIAYSVSQRTREIGVRMALGAPRASVYRMILQEAGGLTLTGVTLGLISSLGAATLMRKLLFGTEAWDAGTLATVALVLAGAAMLASYIPARRAAGVNPVEALRTE
jgi:macrolide transport system ATP-binding/permease protein